MEFAGKTILVVGGSGVFGSLIVERLVALGATVLATCSSNESAERIPDAASQKLLLDLQSDQSIETLANYLNQTHRLDGVVVASGRVGFGRASETTAADAQALMQINHAGPAQLITALAENLGAATAPFVAAITGVVAEKVFPGMAAYTASKTALSTWLTTLRLEQRNWLVLEARPGHTETGLANRALFGEAPKLAQGMAPQHVVDVLFNGLINRKAELASTDF